MLQVLNSLSTDARGLILTMMTGASAVATEAVESVIQTPHIQLLQEVALISTIAVASMTIISYLYRFYKWIKRHCTKRVEK